MIYGSLTGQSTIEIISEFFILQCIGRLDGIWEIVSDMLVFSTLDELPELVFVVLCRYNSLIVESV